MKQIFTIIITLFTIAGYAQLMTAEEWEQESKTNMRLFPKYGHQQKTEEQKEIDQTFINTTAQSDQFKGDRTAASNHMIQLGFDYLYRGDVKTAMYRFNQAYLLDSANTDIYWGYGAVYMNLGKYEKAKNQYAEGLSLDSDNTHLLTDYGTYYMAQYYALQPVKKKKALSNLDTAISYLNKSLQLNKTDQNTLYKLSICHWLKGECKNAFKYYDECKALGGQPIDEGYTTDLNKKCKREK